MQTGKGLRLFHINQRSRVHFTEFPLRSTSLSLSKISRKISAHEFERGGLLKPIVNTIDGTPTFLSIGPQHEGPLGGGGCGQSQHGTAHGGPSGSHHHLHYRPQRLSRNELRQLDERELIFELVGIDAIYISLAGCDIVTVCVV